MVGTGWHTHGPRRLLADVDTASHCSQLELRGASNGDKQERSGSGSSSMSECVVGAPTGVDAEDST